MKVGYYSTANIGFGHIQRRKALEDVGLNFQEPFGECDVIVIDIDWLSYVENGLHLTHQVPTWVLLRFMPQSWIRKAMSIRQPAKVLAIEEFPGSEKFTKLNPLIRTLPKLSRNEVREFYGIDPARKVAAVVHSGPYDEQLQLRFALEDEGFDDIRFFNDSLDAARYSNGFDAIATGAGYNSFNEFNTHQHHICVAFDRGFGEQEWRLSHAPRKQVCNGAMQLKGMLHEAFETVMG